MKNQIFEFCQTSIFPTNHPKQKFWRECCSFPDIGPDGQALTVRTISKRGMKLMVFMVEWMQCINSLQSSNHNNNLSFFIYIGWLVIGCRWWRHRASANFKKGSVWGYHIQMYLRKCICVNSYYMNDFKDVKTPERNNTRVRILE